MRRFGLRIDLMGLGVGEVVRDLPPEDLVPPGEARIVGPRTPRSFNLRMYEGALRPRNGYATFANTPRTSRIVGLALAQFDTAAVDLLRFDLTHVSRLVAGSWSDILSTGLTGTLADPFTTAMVAKSGGGNQMFFCNGVDAVYKYTGGGTTPTTVGSATFTGARTIIGNAGRALCMNVFESSSRRYQRIRYSIVGDPTDFTGTGSGFVDLTNDPFPIANALTIGGRVAVLKGNNIGGGVVVGTLTGSVNNPYRWDSINTNGVGLLFPRTLIPITSDLAFFVGHDAFYVYDGARSMQPVATTISRDILARVNKGALHAGFAWFNADTGEIFVHLPTGTATYPTETWVLNIRDRRVYGPLVWSHNLTATTLYAETGALQWNNLTGTWDTLGLQYASWDAMRGTASSAVTIFGDTNGATWQHDVTRVFDNGSPVTCEYDTAVIRAEGQIVVAKDGSQRQLAADDVLTLQDVTLFSINRGEWTPTINVGVDGDTSFTNTLTADEGPTMGGADQRTRIQSRHFTCSIAGTSFQLRLNGREPMTPHAIRLEFSYVGSERHGN